MKFFSTLLLLCSFSQLLISQTTATLSGHIDHPKGKMIYLTKYSDVLSYEEIPIDSAKLDKKGNFSLTFSCMMPEFIMFNHGDEYTNLFVCPGAKHQLSLDTKMFDETIVHTGDGAASNRFLAEEMLEQENFSLDMYKLSRVDFEEYIDSLRRHNENRIHALDQGLKKNSTCDQEFLVHQKMEAEYLGASELLEYPDMYNYVNKIKTAPPDEGNFELLQLFKVVNPDALVADNYKNFLDSYISHEAVQLSRQDTSSSFLEIKEAFIRKSFDGPVLEYTYANMIYELLTYYGDHVNGEKYLTWFTQAFEKSEFKPVLLRALDKARLLAPGKPAPDFVAVDREGKEFSMHDFKGKLVYLDVWATWCGPCVAEIPGMEKLIKQFEGEDIAFVSISIDPDPERWKSFVQQKDMQGVQLYSGGNFDSAVVKAYGINGIPRYILIDPEGIIIDGNADRPGQIRDKLNELLD